MTGTTCPDDSTGYTAGYNRNTTTDTKRYWWKRALESRITKVCLSAILCCMAVILLLLTSVAIGEFYRYEFCPKVLWPYLVERVYERTPLSNTLQFHHLTCRETGNVYHSGMERVLLDDVDWVVMPMEKDSLAVFSRYGKRGYINRFTGEVAIPALYSKAWVFSEGLAGVVHQGKLKFIDRTGQTVIDNGYEPCRWGEAPLFKNGHCKVYDPLTEKAGLIDKDGKLVLDMHYTDLTPVYGFWKVERNGHYGLYHSQKGWLFHPEHLHIMVYEDRIHVLHQDHITRIYDMDGNLVVDLVIGQVSQLEYPTGETVTDPNDGTSYPVMSMAGCMVYTAQAVDYWERVGLMDRKGHRITPPLYESIEAVAYDRFLCQPHGILIDSHGKRIDNVK